MKPDHADAANDADASPHFVERRAYARHAWTGSDPRGPRVPRIYSQQQKPGMFESIGRLVSFAAMVLLVWAAVLLLFRG